MPINQYHKKYYQPPDLLGNSFGGLSNGQQRQPEPDSEFQLLGNIPNLSTERYETPNMDLETPISSSDTSMQLLREHLSSMPEYQGRGFWGKLLSGAAGMSAGWQGGPEAGLRTAQDYLYQPYQHRLGQWQQKLQPLNQMANLEQMDFRRSLDMRRQELAQKVANANVKEKGYELETNRDKAATGRFEAQTGVARFNQGVKEFLSPKFTGRYEDYTKDPLQSEKYAFDPRTMQKRYLGKGENALEYIKAKGMFDPSSSQQTYNVTPSEVFTANREVPKMVLAKPGNLIYKEFLAEDGSLLPPTDPDAPFGDGLRTKGQAYDQFYRMVQGDLPTATGQVKARQPASINPPIGGKPRFDFKMR